MKYNFYAGPAILPKEVIQQASKAALSFGEMDLSILEVSHRSKPIVEMMERAESLIRSLLGISEDYGVLFLTGGASSQFYMSTMNLLNQEEKAAYVDTGTWSAKAIKEAQLFGNIDVIASSKDDNYTYIPKSYAIADDYKFLHLTSNNTVFGTQYHDWPQTEVPFVCDMSSDIFSRELPIDKFDLIYAGAQKNLGPAGVSLVIVKKEILGKVNRQLPTMLNYQTHINKKSSFNTPPVFPIYVSMLTLEWIERNGGIKAMEERNAAKAKLLYDEIDRNNLFNGVTKKDDRSLMNVCFRINNPELEADFLNLAMNNGCIGLPGHRLTGGFRASIYNAMPIEGVQKLVDIMQEFENQHG